MKDTVLCGNHLDLLADFPDDTFDMFLTSPPYGNLRDYNGYDFQFEPLAHELYRTLKPGGVGVWIVGDATINGSETLTSFKQAIYFKEDVGFNIETMIYEVPSTGAKGSNYFYWQAFEYMFICCKGQPKTSNLIHDIDNTDKKNMFITSGRRKKNGEIKHRKRRRISRDGMSRRKNIWRMYTGYNQFTSTGHPAPFPEKLAEDHILSWSNPGDLILDPMCGSGTTCKMAVKHQRDYIGMDCSSEYCELAKTRIENFLKQTTIFDYAPTV